MPLNERPWQPGAKEGELALALTIAASLFLFPSLLRLILPGAYAVAASAAIGLIAVFFAFPAEVYGIRKVTMPDVMWSIAAVIPIQIFVGLSTLVWSCVLKRLHIEYAAVQPAARWIAQSGFSAELLFYLFTFCIAAPVVEEVLFRRIIFGWLVPCGKIPAMVITALLFAASHFFLYGVAGLWVMSIGFQLLFLKRGNLAASMIAHCAVNLCAVCGVLLIR